VVSPISYALRRNHSGSVRRFSCNDCRLEWDKRIADFAGHSARMRVVPLNQVADYAFAASGSQMLILWVSGIRKRLSTKHIAGTAIG